MSLCDLLGKVAHLFAYCSENLRIVSRLFDSVATVPVRKYIFVEGCKRALFPADVDAGGGGGDSLRTRSLSGEYDVYSELQ